MNSGRPRGLAALLTLALGAGTVAGGGLVGTPAWAEGALTGTYTLDSTSIWNGQQVTLTQTALEDGTPETATERTVSWGDGTTQTLAADVTKVTHKYAANGSYQVAVTLTDDGASTPGTITNATSKVTVATSGGTYKFSPTWNWTWQGGGHEAKLLLSGVPANATRVWVRWGDGETSLVNRANTSVTHRYQIEDKLVFGASVILENAQGKSTPRTVAWYTLKEDLYKPTASLKVPSKPAKASSWKTVQGTAKDSQTGIDVVGVQLWKWTSTKDYYYNFSTKKWVRYTPDVTNIPNTAVKWLPVNSAGVWKVGVSGLSKGYTIQVQYWAYDKAGNYTDYKWRNQKLTS